MQVIYLLNPKCRIRVRRHAPVAARTKAHAAYLWTVRQTRALELLIEEAAAELAKPMLDSLVIVRLHAAVAAIKCFLGKQIDALRAIAESQIIVKEKVVELVRTYEIFCFLRYISVLVGRCELRTYRRVDNVEKDGACSLVNLILGNMAHHMLD